MIKRNPPISRIVKITDTILKYLSINSLTGLPNLYINTEIIKKRNDLLIAEATKNIIKETLKAPADIVKILNGIGVNPAVNIIQKS